MPMYTKDAPEHRTSFGDTKEGMSLPWVGALVATATSRFARPWPGILRAHTPQDYLCLYGTQVPGCVTTRCTAPVLCSWYTYPGVPRSTQEHQQQDAPSASCCAVVLDMRT